MIGAWRLPSELRPPEGPFPGGSLAPGDSLSSPFPQGPVPYHARARVAGQRPPEALRMKRTLEEAPGAWCAQGPVARPPNSNSVVGAELPEPQRAGPRGP